MTFFELTKNRESCRAYSNKRVEREKLTALIEAARLAPSACNSQPWRFVVVDEPAVASKLSTCLYDAIVRMNKFTATCPAFIVVCEMDASLLSKAGGKLKDQSYAPIDIGLATAGICFAATELGLGTCILGWFHEREIKKTLGIPKDKRIRLVIAVGYPKDDSIRQKIRKDIDEIASYNKW